MRPITKEEYGKLNHCLTDLSTLFRKIGIAEFCITKDKRTISWDNTSQIIDPELLNRFCDNILEFYGRENTQQVG